MMSKRSLAAMSSSNDTEQMPGGFNCRKGDSNDRSTPQTNDTKMQNLSKICFPNSTKDCQYFRISSPANANSFTDGTLLKCCDATIHTLVQSQNGDIILPWLGFGTYKIGKELTKDAVINAIKSGYRSIDTAFIYGGETSEKNIGEAMQCCIANRTISGRKELFITSKQWRKYHGYDATKDCLNLSLKRMKIDYIDLYLMHWPGPAYNTMNRRTDVLEKHGPWHYSVVKDNEDMIKIRAESWRAMEDCLRAGLVRAIGVSNMTIEHLERLKESATIWPPSVNQVEFHPLYPQRDLLNYCRVEGITLQAYASLGGQDTGKKQWAELFGLAKQKASITTTDKVKKEVVNLLSVPPVVTLAETVSKSPAQILLRWALDQGVPVIPKTTSIDRLQENANIFGFQLSELQIQQLTMDIQQHLVDQEIVDSDKNCFPLVEKRLCWRNDPLRHLDFP